MDEMMNRMLRYFLTRARLRARLSLAL